MIQRYLDEIIYGGMDGVLTTVSIIAGVYGSNINVIYGFILGVANLLADGFSMGISRYLSLVDINKSNVTRKNAIYRGQKKVVLQYQIRPTTTATMRKRVSGVR